MANDQKQAAVQEASKALHSEGDVARALQVLKDTGLLDLLRIGDVSNKEREDVQERILAEFREKVGRPAQVRTQEIVDAKLKGSKRFKVGLPDGNGNPVLVIPADSEVDAKARYNDVCGINFTETKHVVALQGSKAFKDDSRFVKATKKVGKKVEVEEPEYGPV